MARRDFHSLWLGVQLVLTSRRKSSLVEIKMSMFTALLQLVTTVAARSAVWSLRHREPRALIGCVHVFRRPTSCQFGKLTRCGGFGSAFVLLAEKSPFCLLVSLGAAFSSCWASELNSRLLFKFVCTSGVSSLVYQPNPAFSSCLANVIWRSNWFFSSNEIDCERSSLQDQDPKATSGFCEQNFVASRSVATVRENRSFPLSLSLSTCSTTQCLLWLSQNSCGETFFVSSATNRLIKPHRAALGDHCDGMPYT